MSVAAERLERGLRQVLLVQSLLTLIVMTAFMIVQGWAEAVAAVYGGAITILATLWMGRCIRRTGRLVIGNPTRSKWALYAGVTQRFGFVVAAFALGMGALQLSPLPLLVAFAAAQFGYILAASRC